jgi:FixJ family two-component response regulator
MLQSAVYVVDHDASVRRSLARVLGALGYRVECWADGPSFLETVESSAPSCALVDARLAGSSGLEVIAALRDRRIDLPVIFITGHPEIRMCVQAMKAGAVDFLMKPLRLQELEQAITSAHLLSVNRQHARAEAQRCQRLLASLTVRERQVLRLVLEGRRNKEIAATLDSQESTVKVHRSRVMRKLGVRSIPDLVRIGTSGNLPSLLRRDRRPAGRAMPLRMSEPEASAGSDATEPPNAWFGAAGTWSGFTWPTAVPRARHHD